LRSGEGCGGITKLTIKEKAEYVGTFRAIRVFMMETLARWTPTSPELEVKVTFGRHIWECAQHADALGRRSIELRAPLHQTLPPAAEYRKVLQAVDAVEDSSGRLVAFYDFLLPSMVARQHAYLENVDPLHDEPTVRILSRIARDDQRMIEEKQQLLAQVPVLRAQSGELLLHLRGLDEAAGAFVSSSGAQPGI
jgi:hypothetical protein